VLTHPTKLSLPGRSIWTRRRAVAAALTLTLVAGLLITLTWSAPPERASRAQREPAVGGSIAAPVRPAPAATGRPFQATPPVWPRAASLDVRLPAAGVNVGGLPVSLSALGGQRSTVAGVRVETLDRATTRAAGVHGVLLRVDRTDAGTADAGLRVGVGYSAFRTAYGADWAARLRLVAMPECALRTPSAAQCRPRVARTTNNLAKSTVSADVSLAAGGPTLVALAAGPSGATGDSSATSLASSGTWSVGGGSGDFNWTYPIRVPPALGGPTPQVVLAYSSSSVDGRMAASNNQPSMIGEGFDFSPGFLERRYRSCAADMTPGANNGVRTGDQCWATDNATMSMSGHAGELIRDASDIHRWHLRNNDGIRVERRSDAGNGARDGEWWMATTTDGTQYWFGGRPASNSTLTVPVYGNHAGEPCHATTFAASSCQQGYRWLLDHVVDTHGNTLTYTYVKETNKYARAGVRTDLADYDRAAYVERIEYGTRNGVPGPAPAQVLFGMSDRCLSNCGADASWPDTPRDQACTAAPCDTGSPTFWTAKRLATVTTRVWEAGRGDYRDVESWTLTHSFPSPGDGTRAGLWLDRITHRGLVGGTITMPDITFEGQQLSNRVDTADHSPAMNWWRLKTIKTETGGQITVTYSDPDCVAGSRMPDPNALHANALRCYPVRWTPEGYDEPVLDFFHKYVVTDVAEADRTGGSVRVRTHYDYLDTPAWRYTDDDGLIDVRDKTWSVWRGHGKVRITVGDPGEQTVTETRYFRGMHGDKLPTGTRVVSLPAVGAVPAVNDEDGFAGMARESIVYNGPGGPEVSATVHEPWWSPPKATRTINGATAESRFVGTAATHTRTALDGGRPPRTTTVRSTFDDAYGLTTRVDDSGDNGVTGDERCTFTDYARTDTSRIVAAISRQRTFAVTCARASAGGLTDDDVVDDSRTSYDDKAWGIAPTVGEVTHTEVLTAYNGGNPTWLTTAQTAYDDYGRPESTTDVRGNTTRTEYTPATGGPVTSIKETNALGWTGVRNLEPAWGSVVSTEDANGRRTATTYDALGRTTAAWGPGRDKDTQSPNVKYEYLVRDDGPVVVTTSGLKPDGGYAKAYALYDGLLRPRQTQAPDRAGGTAAVVTDTLYDSAGRAFRAHHPYLAFDTDEHPVPPGTGLFRPDQPIPALTVTEFDGVGRAKATIFAVGASPASPGGTERWRSTVAYTGDRTDATPPRGGTVTSAVTDAAGHTIALRQYHAGVAAGAPTGFDESTYRYNRKGQLVEVKNPAGNRWTYAYDIRGRLKTTTDPDRGTATVEYNDVGDVMSTTDGRDVTLTYTYDQLGRKKNVRDASDVRAEWTYDTLSNGTVVRGQAVKSVRRIGQDAYVSEILGINADYQPSRVRHTIPASVTGLGGTYEYIFGYYQDGSAKTVGLPKVGDLAAETITYEYDGLGQPSTLKTSLGAAYVTATDYSSFGELAAVDLQHNGGQILEITRTYDTETRRLAQILNKPLASTAVNDVRYSYDEAGNIKKVSDLAAGDHQCFGIDHLRRLTEAWTPTSGDCGAAPAVGGLGGPARYWNSFTYDKVGNRTKQVEHVTPAGERTTTYTPVPGKHALASTTTVDGAGTRTAAYTYDQVGNTRTRPAAGSGTQTLTWDVENLLGSVDDNTGVTSFVYDAAGGRLIRHDPAGSTLYLPGQELRFTIVGGSKRGTRYYSHAGLVVASRSGSTVTWLAGDHQGTTQSTVTATTQSVATRRQTPFGTLRGGGTGTWPSFLDKGFQFGTQDPTGLTHLGAREYDPAIGRFVSVDPVFDAADPQSWHGYAYADNSPVTFSDPNGLQCLEACGTQDNRDYYEKPAQDARRRHQAQAAKELRHQCRTTGDCTTPKPGFRMVHFANGTVLVIHEDGTATINGYILPPGEVDAYKFAELADKRRGDYARRGRTGIRLTMVTLGLACGDYNTLVGRSGKGCAEDFAFMLFTDVGAVDDTRPGEDPESKLYYYNWEAYYAAWGAIETGGKTGFGFSRRPPRCGGRSFDAETPVLMADGTTKKIKEVRVGDQVIAKDPETGETAAKPVTHLHHNLDVALADVMVRADGGRQYTLHTTQHHQLWSNTRRTWLDTDELLPGEQLRTPDGDDVRVVTVRRPLGAQWMHDLTVADIHTYYVVAGDTPVLVHNDGDGCVPLPTQKQGQTQRLTNAQATELADYLGYRYTGQSLRGERVFTNGRTYIVQDSTSHTGGTWKIAGSIRDLNRRETRTATTDALLNPIGD